MDWDHFWKHYIFLIYKLAVILTYKIKILILPGVIFELLLIIRFEIYENKIFKNEAMDVWYSVGKSLWHIFLY